MTSFSRFSHMTMRGTPRPRRGVKEVHHVR